MDNGGSSGGAPLRETPPDQNLAIEVIHPNGMTLSLSKLAFKGNDIFLDIEVINSSRYDCTLHYANTASDRLRLVDDAGQEYNFIEPDENNPEITLAPGETLNGTLAFRGPLRGEPGQLILVTNLDRGEVSGYSLKSESDSTQYPRFAVPVDLAQT